MLRSADFPEGSPMRPVAPPTSAMTLCPACWKRFSTMIETRFPACSERAEGSKPQYTVIGRSSASSIDGSVSASTSPRALSSSISFIGRIIPYPRRRRAIYGETTEVAEPRAKRVVMTSPFLSAAASRTTAPSAAVVSEYPRSRTPYGE